MWVGAIAWQIGYDTVYAYVDVADDTRLCLKSTAILFGRRGQAIVGLFYALTVGAWAVGGGYWTWRCPTLSVWLLLQLIWLGRYGVLTSKSRS